MVGPDERPEQGCWKRNEHDRQKQKSIGIDEQRRGLAHQFEHAVVVHPRDEDDDETQSQCEDFGAQMPKGAPQLGAAANTFHRGDLDVDDQQGQRDGEDPVAEGFKPGVGV